MIDFKLNGLDVTVEQGMTILEASQFMGFPIPTLCHMEGLSPYGACRLCVVELGEGPRAKLVTSCTYPAQDGLVVRTASHRVVRARRMIIELLLAFSLYTVFYILLTEASGFVLYASLGSAILLLVLCLAVYILAISFFIGTARKILRAKYHFGHTFFTAAINRHTEAFAQLGLHWRD